MDNKIVDSPLLHVPVLFLGSKSLGFNLFKTLYSQDTSINWAVLHPDDALDNRSQIQAFQDYCERREIQFVVGSSKALLRDLIEKHRPKIAIVCGWYSILSEEILSLVPDGFWGIHHSLLPKYRGSAPLVWAIINGDEYLGSTIFRFDKGIDSGPILSQVTLRVSEEESISTISEILEKFVLEEFLKYWPTLVTGEVQVVSQNDLNATYSGQRVEMDSRIDWKRNANVINNHIRAQQFPYPIAHSYWNGKTIEFLKSTKLDTSCFGTPGQIVSKNEDGIVVACGENSGILISQVKVDQMSLHPRDFPFTSRSRFHDV